MGIGHDYADVGSRISTVVGSEAKVWVGRGGTRRRVEVSAGMKEREEIETERETVVGSRRVLVNSANRGRTEEVRAQRGWWKVNCLLWRLGVKLSF